MVNHMALSYWSIQYTIKHGVHFVTQWVMINSLPCVLKYSSW